MCTNQGATDSEANEESVVAIEDDVTALLMGTAFALARPSTLEILEGAVETDVVAVGRGTSSPSLLMLFVSDDVQSVRLLACVEDSSGRSLSSASPNFALVRSVVSLSDKRRLFALGIGNDISSEDVSVCQNSSSHRVLAFVMTSALSAAMV